MASITSGAAAAAAAASGDNSTPLSPLLTDSMAEAVRRLKQAGFPEAVAKAAAAAALGKEGALDAAGLERLERPIAFVREHLSRTEKRIQELIAAKESPQAAERLALAEQRPLAGKEASFGCFYGAVATACPNIPPENSALKNARKSLQTPTLSSTAECRALVRQLEQGNLDTLIKALDGGEVEGLIYSGRVVSGVGRTELLREALSSTIWSESLTNLIRRLTGEHAEPFEPWHKSCILQPRTCGRPEGYLAALALIIKAPEVPRDSWEDHYYATISGSSGARYYCKTLLERAVKEPDLDLVKLILAHSILTKGDLDTIASNVERYLFLMGGRQSGGARVNDAFELVKAAAKEAV